MSPIPGEIASNRQHLEPDPRAAFLKVPQNPARAEPSDLPAGGVDPRRHLLVQLYKRARRRGFFRFERDGRERQMGLGPVSTSRSPQRVTLQQETTDLRQRR